MASSRRKITTLAVMAATATGLVLGAGPAGAAATAWRTVATADPSPGAPGDYLLGDVSCVSTSDCTAVGWRSVSASQASPLIERWNGTAWSVVASPMPTGAQSAYLMSVSCSSATWCMAVGKYLVAAGDPAETAFAVVWDGTGWAVRDIGAPATLGWRLDVDCVSPTWCKLAGGFYGQGGTARAWAATWNGTGVTVDTVPVPATATSTAFTAVSCVASDFCAAVGATLDASGVSPALAETWDGTAWHQDLALSTDSRAELRGVSCPAKDVCFAVGSQTLSNAADGYAVRKVGSLWIPLPVPNPSSGSEKTLGDVSCTSSSNCVAVGWEFGQRTSVLGYAMSWNGLQWTVEWGPATTGGVLWAVACPADAYCVGVGMARSPNVTGVSAVRSGK